MEIYQLKATFKTDRKCTLPRFKTMMFRGIFGNAFKKIKHINPKVTDCFSCYLAAKCDFAVNFHNMNFHPDNLPEKYLKFTNFPAKFIFLMTDENHYYDQDSSLEVLISFMDFPRISLQDLVLIFKEISEYVVDKSSNARLLFDSLTDNTEQSLLYKNDRFYCKRLNQLKLKKITENTNTIDFTTLCRISSNSMLVSNEINSSIFARRMKERLSLLTVGLMKSYVPQWENDELDLIQKNLRWIDIKHKSNRQKSKIILGGFLGQLCLKCCNQAFWEDLSILEQMHIGTNAQGGYGKFTILN